MKEISKSFPGVQALSRVDFDLVPGEVHALVGENGAGKSTLMRILSGEYPHDSGEIWIGSEEVTHLNPHKAQKLGISMVHQALKLINYLSVSENVLMD